MVKAIISRVKKASVSVNEKLISEINQGILIYLGINRNDTKSEIEKLAKKVCNIRLWNNTPNENDEVNFKF